MLSGECVYTLWFLTFYVNKFTISLLASMTSECQAVCTESVSQTKWTFPIQTWSKKLAFPIIVQLIWNEHILEEVQCNIYKTCLLCQWSLFIENNNPFPTLRVDCIFMPCLLSTSYVLACLADWIRNLQFTTVISPSYIHSKNSVKAV